MEIDKSYVDSLAVNSDAIKNANSVMKKFTKFYKSPDGTLLFGECAGSGKKPYTPSADFINPSSPIFRCNCPSRQIPCKHTLALLYSYAVKKPFVDENIPEDIISKRNKIEKREENKEKKLEVAKTTAPKKMTKAKQTALIKKIDAQLEGVSNAEKILFNISTNGFNSIDKLLYDSYNEQIKNLANFYISGIQASIETLLDLIINTKSDDYSSVISEANFVFALLTKAKQYLNTKKENPEYMDTDSPIEEQIGYAFKLDELIQKQKFIENAKLIQLSFYIYFDPIRNYFVDEGHVLELTTKKLFKTKNYRPLKALKHIKQDDSISKVINTNMLVVYPGDLNPRVRYNDFTLKNITQNDIKDIKLCANTNFKQIEKDVKASIKSPLADKNPIVLVKVDSIKKVKDLNFYEIYDDQKNSLILGNINQIDEDYNILFDKICLDKDICLLLMMANDLSKNKLVGRPIAIINNNNIFNLI